MRFALMKQGKTKIKYSDMKKAIFFFLLALSVSSSAQNLRPAQGIDFKEFNHKENILKRLEEGGIMSGLHKENQFFKTTENKTSRQILLFPIIDSIYSWQ